MKYSIRQYAEALFDVLLEIPEKERPRAIKNFLNLVRKNGDSPKLLLIVRALEKEYVKRNGLRLVRIEMASPVSERVKKNIIKILGEKIVYMEHEDADLIGGIRIIVDDEILIDASVKRQIDCLFKI